MFAIRQKSTGYWLPPFAKKRGHTHAEVYVGAVPRLFRRRQDAATALRWWLEGAHTQVVDFEYGDCDLKVLPRPERKADDMEVVSVQLTVI